MKIFLWVIISLFSVIATDAYAQTLTSTGALDTPISVSTDASDQIYTATSNSKICTAYEYGVTADNAAGTNITVGDIFSLSDGTQITVDTVDASKKMSTFHISLPAYSTTVPNTGNSWAGKISVTDSKATVPCMNEAYTTVLRPRMLDSVKSETRSIKDFGATMDGSTADRTNIQFAYDATPDGGVIHIPCNSVWPVNPRDNTGDWSPTHTSGKSVVYMDTCGLKWNGEQWGGWPYMDHAIGDDDLKFQLAKGVMALNRQEFSTIDNHALLNVIRDVSPSISITGGGSWGNVYSYTPSVYIQTSNGASGKDGKATGGSIMGLKTETHTYSNQPWSVQDVAFMPTARRYGTSSIWSFSMELDDETGLPASTKFEETNEIDIDGSGEELPSCINDPKECARMPLYFGLAHRDFGGWAANHKYTGGLVGYPYNPATNSTAWTADTWNPHFVPAQITVADSSGIQAHYQALTTGTSGTTAPRWPTTNGTTVCDGVVDSKGKTNCTDPTQPNFGVLWKRTSNQQTEIGTPVWFNVDDEYLDASNMTSTFKYKGGTGPYVTYLTSAITNISGNAPVHNAFMDTSWTTMADESTVGIRMSPNQRIDFSNLWIHADGTFKNQHTLSYDYVNQNDTRCGFVINDTSKSTNQATQNNGSSCYINWADGAVDTTGGGRHLFSSSTTQITPDILKSTYSIEGVWGYRSNGNIAFGIYDSGPAVLPKMTKSSILAIPHPRTAMLVYDTDDNEYVYYNGTNWKIIAPGNTLQ